jgi:alginate O-acetyltransferase complex protein AlgI
VTLNVVLPVGISFYTFQALSYSIDVYRGQIKPTSNIIAFFAYISFFPQLVAGPIERATNLLPQFLKKRQFNYGCAVDGMRQMLWGFLKKLAIADNCAYVVNSYWNAYNDLCGFSLLFLGLLFSIQIYCDFSGYSNIAIGIARIWDFDLGTNFNAPYIAKNPSDFWRRWHISLSTWFRDYVYIPLGGSRKGTFKTYFNLFITMVLSGIWHGANSTFIVWGIVHGFASALNRGFNDYLKRNNKKVNIPSGLSILINYIFVSLAWVIFRADSFNHALTIYKCIFNSSGLLYVNVYVLVFIIIYIFINLLSMIKNSGNIIEVNLNLDSLKNKFIISVWIWLIVVFMYCGNSAFIYAQF